MDIWHAVGNRSTTRSSSDVNTSPAVITSCMTPRPSFVSSLIGTHGSVCVLYPI
jgi:hypothetical protein